MFEQESSGILNRLLEGERAWFKEGLQKDNLPSVIAKATGEHRKRKHDIDHFFEGSTVTGDMALWERAGYLYWAYELWAKEVNVRPMNRGAFKKELLSHGCDHRRGDNSPEKGSGWVYYGIRLDESIREFTVESFDEDATDS